MPWATPSRFVDDPAPHLRLRLDARPSGGDAGVVATARAPCRGLDRAVAQAQATCAGSPSQRTPRTRAPSAASRVAARSERVVLDVGEHHRHAFRDEAPRRVRGRCRCRTRHDRDASRDLHPDSSPCVPFRVVAEAMPLTAGDANEIGAPRRRRSDHARAPHTRRALRQPARIPVRATTWTSRTAGRAARCRLHHLDEGPRDARVVLLMHGNPSVVPVPEDDPPIVAAGYRCVAPDLVGLGRSDKPSRLEDYTVARHVEWMRARRSSTGSTCAT